MKIGKEVIKRFGNEIVLKQIMEDINTNSIDSFKTII